MQRGSHVAHMTLQRKELGKILCKFRSNSLREVTQIVGEPFFAKSTQIPIQSIPNQH